MANISAEIIGHAIGSRGLLNKVSHPFEFIADQKEHDDFGGFTGEVVVTGRDSEIIYHTKPA